MLVFVFFDQHTEHVHEGGERMIFIFANCVGDTIEQIHELPVIRFGVRHTDGARYGWPSLRNIFQFDN